MGSCITTWILGYEPEVSTHRPALLMRDCSQSFQGHQLVRQINSALLQKITSDPKMKRVLQMQSQLQHNVKSVPNSATAVRPFSSLSLGSLNSMLSGALTAGSNGEECRYFVSNRECSFFTIVIRNQNSSRVALGECGQVD